MSQTVLVEKDLTNLLFRIKQALESRRLNALELGKLFLSLKNQVPSRKFKFEIQKLGRAESSVYRWIDCYQQHTTPKQESQLAENKRQKSQLSENTRSLVNVVPSPQCLIP